MSRRIRLYRTRIKAWGLRRALHAFIMQAFAKAGFHIHDVEVGAERYDLMDPNPPSTPTGYTTRICGKDDLLPFVGDETHLSQEFLEQAFARGDVCAASFFHERPVAYKFETRNRTQVTDQIDVIIPEGFVYSYKAWTHLDHRQLGLTRACAYELIRKRRDERCHDRVIWYVEKHNYAALLHGPNHPREWSLLMGYVGWLTLFGKQIPYNSRWANRIGFIFVRVDDDRPRMVAGAQSR